MKTLATLFLALATITAAADPAPAVARMTWEGGQCSAVCIDPAGLLVTVKHCSTAPEAVF
jgi:hypothetical protein